MLSRLANSLRLLVHRSPSIVPASRLYSSQLGSRKQATSLWTKPRLRRFAASVATPLVSRDSLPGVSSGDRYCRTAAAATMEVTRHNFVEVLPVVREALAGCSFFAFDLEMTGLHVRDSRFCFHDDIQDQYAQMVESAQHFQITQFGLSAFQWEGGRYIARTFNFYVFPRPDDGFDTRFLSQAGSMDFLARQGFDFTKWVRDGIGYLPAAVRDVRLAVLRAQREGGSDVGADGVRRDGIALVKQPDIDFTAQLRADVDAWLKGGEETLLLEQVNGYYRRLQYQYLGTRGTPATAGFVIERLGDGRQAVLQLRRQTAEQAAEWQAAQLRDKEAGIHRAAGFTAVLQAMRDSGAPAVGHNLALDLAYTLEAFAGPLPAQWQEYRALTAAWFPGGVYDTKRLSSELPEVFQGQTSLGEVYDIISGAQVEARMPDRQHPVSLAAAGVAADALPPVQHADGFVRYQGDEADSFAHEAGYDAYMTAASFAALLRLLELRGAAVGGNSSNAADTAQQPSLTAAQQFLGQLNLMRTDIPYAALVGEDPLPERRHVFHIAGLPPGSRHNEISTAFALAGIGRIHTVMLDAAGTTAAVSVVDTEAVDRVFSALAGWGTQVTPFAEWAQQSRAAADVEMQNTTAVAPQSAHVAAPPLRDGRGPVKRRRLVAPGAVAQAGAAEGPTCEQRTSCVIQ